MGIPLRAGRFFDDHDREGTPRVIVIDENLARHAFDGQDPVGRRLWISSMGTDPVRVVGVVGHVRHWGLATDDRSRVRDQLYYPFAQVPDPLLRFFSSIMSIAVRTRVPPLDPVESLRTALRGSAGDQALYDVRTMEELVSASLARQRFLMLLFGTFAATALLLASAGIYGVLAYLTGRRAPEIGVRMALGATAADVIMLVVGQSVTMIVAGVGLGTAAAWTAGHLLVRLVDGMRPMDAWTLLGVILVLVAAALLASYVPARRASRVDAWEVVRQD
jgi:ABC-type antimicrobial peptide transport system permease subunit